jgi:hypothetical protein
MRGSEDRGQRRARPSEPGAVGRAARSRARRGGLEFLAIGLAICGAIGLATFGTRQPGGPGPASPEPTKETFVAEAINPGLSPVSETTPSPAVSPAVASSSPIAAADHVATRVRVPALGIDLAVVAPPKDPDAYPKCGVAMYIAGLHQPGEKGATYLYAHARDGMFGAIYQRAIEKRDGGPWSMLGMSVDVFTSDNLRYLYRIDEVRLHQVSLADAAHARTPELWLQTSEGPTGTRGKTQLLATPVAVRPATAAQAHPAASPSTCG